MVKTRFPIFFKPGSRMVDAVKYWDRSVRNCDGVVGAARAIHPVVGHQIRGFLQGKAGIGRAPGNGGLAGAGLGHADGGDDQMIADDIQSGEFHGEIGGVAGHGKRRPVIIKPRRAGSG